VYRYIVYGTHGSKFKKVKWNKRKEGSGWYVLYNMIFIELHSCSLKPGPHWQQCRSNVRLYRKDEISTQISFDIVAVFGSKVERCFDIVAKNGNIVEATFDFVAFDNVASTWLLVWTGLKFHVTENN